MFKNSLRTLFEKAVQNLLHKLLTISIITPTRMLGRERDAEHWGNSQHTASTGTLGRPFAGETVTMRSMTTATSSHPCTLSCNLWNAPNQRRSPDSASTCMWPLAFWPIPRIVCLLSPRSASKRQPYRRKLSAWRWLARTTWARNLTFALKLKTTCASSCTTLSSSATTRITGVRQPSPGRGRGSLVLSRPHGRLEPHLLRSHPGGP